MSDITTHVLGYPRIGEQRELKKAVERYWRGEASLEDLEAQGRELRARHWHKQVEAGLDLVTCNDFSFYDSILDASCLFGNVPARFGNADPAHPDTAFAIARGERRPGGAAASEMTKWFDTNYHYIVPEFHSGTTFHVASEKIFAEFVEASALGYRAKPVLCGPVSYLSLGKVHGPGQPTFDRFELLDRLLPVYEEILSRLAAQGAEWIQLDEPVLALDLSEAQRDALVSAYARLAKAAGPAKLLVATYFGELRDNLPLFLSLPVAALHYDAVRGAAEVEGLLAVFPADKILSLGVVDGRNIWKNDYAASLAVLEKARSRLPGRLWISASCSLLHAPVSLRQERALDLELRNWLAFADEKLREIATLRDLLTGTESAEVLASNRAASASRRGSARIHRPEVKQRLAEVTPDWSRRVSAFPERRPVQQAKLKLPAFPTTTIGSFPQTAEVRAARARWKKGLLSDSDYETFLRQETARCVAFQEDAGIDMLVHGEFERNDMVEYFGEQLDGFAFTTNGWVQSYGSRCVKPPLIYGDVQRPRPMTVEWSRYAQSLTQRPMKGMLTGPVTILQWSFVRDDQPRELTTRQIALAIRDEVTDLEACGLAAIQIDEPALREGLPLRRIDWQDYLRWAVDAFRLCSSSVRDETQIHTHMCYCDFNDIIAAIADLDADVITIETSRSAMELLDAFVSFRYPNEIGPGVYDIHSPRVPAVEEMEHLLDKAAAVLDPGSLWVNPDCGLKTRDWPEVEAALRNMVTAARRLREKTTGLRDRNARISGPARHG